MHASDLTGMRVVDIDDAREVGTVSDLMIDLERHAVTDLMMRAGVLGGTTRLVPMEAVQAVGRDAITVRQSGITPDMGKAHAGAVPLGRLQGIQIMVEDGTRLGALKDVELDPESGRISAYIYSHGGVAGMFSQQETIEVGMIRRASRDMFVASQEAVAQRAETSPAPADQSSEVERTE